MTTAPSEPGDDRPAPVTDSGPPVPEGGSPSADSGPPTVEAAPDRLDRTELFGLPFVNAVDLDPVIDQLLGGAEPPDGLLPLVLTPNVDIVVHLDANADRPEAALFRQAQYCLPDGQPVVLASRLLDRPLGGRLAGSTLFDRLWPRLVGDGVPMVVVASSDEIVTALSADGPEAEFIVPPYVSADDEAALGEIADQIVAAARRIRPRLLLLGIGNPKDARIVAAVIERWDPSLGALPVSMGLGASFALHLGLQRRAPEWIQRIGMEWFHRFLQEPRRLFKRYFVDDTAFIGIVWREWRRHGRGPRPGEPIGGASPEVTS